MADKKTKLELTWTGKEDRPKLEPRILLEDAGKSYHAPRGVGENSLHSGASSLHNGANSLHKAAGSVHNGSTTLRCALRQPHVP